jgi:hypothetical protein
MISVPIFDVISAKAIEQEIGIPELEIIFNSLDVDARITSYAPDSKPGLPVRILEV